MKFYYHSFSGLHTISITVICKNLTLWGKKLILLPPGWLHTGSDHQLGHGRVYGWVWKFILTAWFWNGDEMVLGATEIPLRIGIPVLMVLGDQWSTDNSLYPYLILIGARKELLIPDCVCWSEYFLWTLDNAATDFGHWLPLVSIAAIAGSSILKSICSFAIMPEKTKFSAREMLSLWLLEAINSVTI